MARRVARFTLDTLATLPYDVRSCLTWELDPVRRAQVDRAGAAVEEKEAWVSRVLLEWGSCGRVLYVDDEPAGFVLYAPPAYFPGTASFPTAPLSEDAVQLATAEVFEEYAGAGLGRVLMQEMVKDLLKRGDFRSVEAIGVNGARPVTGHRSGAADDCVLPAPYLQRVGFKTHRAHLRYPRMRMEMKSVLTWREEMETALSRLLGVVRPRRAAAAQRLGRFGPTSPPVPPRADGP
jgi:GNAT superfamily N-acetyltransferase